MMCNLESNIIQISQKKKKETAELISLKFTSNSHKWMDHLRFEYLAKKNMHVEISRLVKYTHI